MSEYLLEKNSQSIDKELARLQLIEAVADSNSIKHLKSTGIKEGWNCLELGAGSGSILKWMGGQTKESGNAVGIDRNTNYIKQYTQPPYTILGEDIVEADFEMQFDLVHCRYVLIHNKNDMEILSKIFSILKPGGYVVLEEPDFTSSTLLADKEASARNNVSLASCGVFSDRGLDPAFGLKLPNKLSSLGFEIEDVHPAMHLSRGGSEEALMASESVKALKSEFVATGKAEEKDIDEYVLNANDKDYWTVYFTTVSVIARKPHL